MRHASLYAAYPLMQLLPWLLDSHRFGSFRAKPCLLSCFIRIFLWCSCLYTVHGYVFSVGSHGQGLYSVCSTLDSRVVTLTFQVSGFLYGRVVSRVHYHRGVLWHFFFFHVLWLRFRCFCRRVSVVFLYHCWGGTVPSGFHLSLGQARSFIVLLVLYDSPLRSATLLGPCPPGAPPLVKCCLPLLLHMLMFVRCWAASLFAAS